MSDFNVIVSSWPSAGGTTLALILAELVGLKYIYAGGVLKEWASRMGFDPATDALHDWEQLYGEEWDKFWEGYIMNKFTRENGLLCEGKTAGFLLPEGKAYEIMITANSEARQKRATGDSREETIAERDKQLQKRWVSLFNVDIFDELAIQKNYDLHIDNSFLSIADSLMLASDGLKKWINKMDAHFSFEYTIEKYKLLETEFWAGSKSGSGKDAIRKRLAKRDLYISASSIFADWRENYSIELSKLPKAMLRPIAEPA